jgi:hypothetical protein
MANWIAVRKAKPAIAHRVLVINKVGHITIAERLKERHLGGTWMTDGGNIILGVQYWAALPPKPERLRHSSTYCIPREKHGL